MDACMCGQRERRKAWLCSNCIVPVSFRVDRAFWKQMLRDHVPQDARARSALRLRHPSTNQMMDLFAFLRAASADVLPPLSARLQQTEVPQLKRPLAEIAQLGCLRNCTASALTAAKVAHAKVTSDRWPA